VRRIPLVAIAGFLMLTASPCAAEYEALRQADDRTDDGLAWEIAGGYFPYGREGAAWDEKGAYYAYTRFVGERQLSLSATWRFRGRTALSFTVRSGATEIRELRIYAAGTRETSACASEGSFVSYWEYRLAPAHPLDPRIRITHRIPASTEAAATVSHLLDPVVLGGMMGIRKGPRDPHGSLHLILSAGLVANSRVSLAVVGEWGIPMQGADLPRVGVSIYARYALSRPSMTAIRFRMTISTRNGTAWIGFGGSVSGSLAR